MSPVADNCLFLARNNIMPKTALQMIPNEWKRYGPSVNTAREVPERPLVEPASRENML